MKEPITRMKLTDVPLEKMGELEAMVGPWFPEVWRLLADSLFITLLSHASWREMSEAELCVLLTLGIGEDLGGAQYYIPSGRAKVDVCERNQLVLGLLREGKSYREVAIEIGISDSQVRKLERKHRSGRAAAASKG
jgi:hypothetical protein